MFMFCVIKPFVLIDLNDAIASTVVPFVLLNELVVLGKMKPSARSDLRLTVWEVTFTGIEDLLFLALHRMKCPETLCA